MTGGDVFLALGVLAGISAVGVLIAKALFNAAYPREKQSDRELLAEIRRLRELNEMAERRRAQNRNQ